MGEDFGLAWRHVFGTGTVEMKPHWTHDNQIVIRHFPWPRFLRVAAPYVTSDVGKCVVCFIGHFEKYLARIQDVESIEPVSVSDRTKPPGAVQHQT